ncbi:hypothetical protein BD779DRAFT_1581799 [Infundibulicybe gibba]|nr:hypothetical protein BD779DRAFT_1581799 [Infundibulicybe gibba]
MGNGQPGPNHKGDTRFTRHVVASPNCWDDLPSPGIGSRFGPRNLTEVSPWACARRSHLVFKNLYGQLLASATSVGCSRKLPDDCLQPSQLRCPRPRGDRRITVRISWWGRSCARYYTQIPGEDVHSASRIRTIWCFFPTFSSLIYKHLNRINGLAGPNIGSESNPAHKRRPRYG